MGSAEDEEIEHELERVFVHESGHAFVATRLGIPCDGIYFQIGDDGGMFCAVFPGGSRSAVSKEDCLVSAAGAAAELVFYPNRESEGDNRDREDFGETSALSYDQAMIEARAILLKGKKQLVRLVATLNQRVKGVDFDLTKLPAKQIDGIPYRILLCHEDLQGVLAESR